MIKAIKTGKKDNVATVINNVEVGQVINIFNKDGSFYKIKSKAKILFGHKISIKDINIDEFIIKYDTSIGRAKKKIPQGFNVHVNMTLIKKLELIKLLRLICLSLKKK